MNKTILVSGANGNLGVFFSRKILETTNHSLILLVHKSTEKIRTVSEKYPDRCILIKADIRNFEDIKIKLDNALGNRYLSAFLHTASIRSSDFKILSETESSNWKNVIETNILGTYNLLKIVLPVFKKQKEGRIVLMGSNVSRIGLPNGSAYSVSKAAMANLSRTVALEESQNNILINTVSPGPIEIDDSHFPESYRKFREKYYKNMLAQTPLKRLATLQDVYNIVEFLLSEKNTYITGEEIFVTGGKL